MTGPAAIGSAVIEGEEGKPPAPTEGPPEIG
jgi:hypothetical protein